LTHIVARQQVTGQLRELSSVCVVFRCVSSSARVCYMRHLHWSGQWSSPVVEVTRRR